MHHHDLEIDRLHGTVQTGMDAYFAEPVPSKLELWERLAGQLWGMETERNRELRAGGHGEISLVWRGPNDQGGLARRDRRR
jgi:hypothetical protein